MHARKRLKSRRTDVRPPAIAITSRICELVEHHLEEVMLKGAWAGPAALHLSPHALAPVADLPVLEVVSTIQILADLATAFTLTWSETCAVLWSGTSRRSEF